MKRTLGVVLAALVLAGCGSTDSDAETTKMSTAYNACSDSIDAIVMGSIELGDGDHSIIVDGVRGEKGFDALSCVINGLGLSDALRSRINSTTALQGQQSAEEDGLSYEWSFHPDNGVNMTVSEN